LLLQLSALRLLLRREGQSRLLTAENVGTHVNTRTVLVTGGAGFIGANAAKRYLDEGWSVVVVDNLSRPGSKKNLEWLRTQGRFQFEEADVRDARRISDLVASQKNLAAVLHLAAQV